ncbi:uncharacterized protein LOC108219774 isoform X3 [Daucus carota subsp. sativus]|uniref:uncharacterized protein LOC108219774 isoform X3 n=1 Tax=Daucus carota subsp. sativus TaxID=79200 RepID=UPI003083A40C
MKILTSSSTFPLFNKKHHQNFPSKPNKISDTKLRFRPCMVSIKPPPPGFDFRTEYLLDSRETIAQTHPELLDLADNGTLVLIRKSQFGPVPGWRTEFVEPEVIWLIGTSHVSSQSAVDVERVVRTVKPDNVVVELCRSSLNSLVAEFIFRAGIMFTSNDNENGPKLKSNMFSLSGDGFFGAVGRSLNLGGQTALALRLLLAILSSKVSTDVKRPFGDEFRVARKTSEEVGAQIVLGDRPIEITLERAWNSLKLSEKVNLIGSVVRGITLTSDISSDTLKYIAWSLKRSKAVNSSKKVVGVIGKGHMNGVIYALVSDSGELRFRDLVGQRSSGNENGGWLDTLAKNLVRDTVIGVLLWALFEQLNTGVWNIDFASWSEFLGERWAL